MDIKSVVVLKGYLGSLLTKSVDYAGILIAQVSTQRQEFIIFFTESI